MAIKLKPGGSVSRIEGVTRDASADCYLKGQGERRADQLRRWVAPAEKTVLVEGADDEFLAQLTEWMARHDD